MDRPSPRDRRPVPPVTPAGPWQVVRVALAVVRIVLWLWFEQR